MDFYDDLTPFYHLIFPDWDGSIDLQGAQIQQMIEAEWPGSSKVLDIACGIGTQSLALAKRGYTVTASDLSRKEIERARHEARVRGLAIDFRVGDMREAHTVHGGGFDIVLSFDNAMPHLQTDEELLQAFRQMRQCLRPGGGCLISVRDYAQEVRGRNLIKPHGAQTENGKRYVLFQVWDFDSDTHYDFDFFILEEDLATLEVKTRVLRSRYYAIATTRLVALMEEAGFAQVRRLDGVFYQPVLVGSRPI